MKQVAAYAAQREPNLDEVVRDHANLVMSVAHHLAGRLPRSVPIDDLVQAGMVGLLEAARNFDDGKGASFPTFARIRIRGAMFDELRRYSWEPRSVHRKMREITEAIRDVEQAEGRDARPADVAARLGVSPAEYGQIVSDALGRRVFNLEDLTTAGEERFGALADPAAGPEREVSNGEVKRRVAEAIASLPERERLVVSLYYYEEMNLREIGEVLGVTMSRVCQIQGQALLRIKARLSPLREE